jgi:hypothetical protein
VPRNLTADMVAALDADWIRPILFVTLNFTSTPVYLWSGAGSIVWSGQTWLGLGPLLSVSSTEETSTVEAKGITITLSGLDTTLLPDTLADFQLGLPVDVYLGVFASNGTIVSSPISAWAGRTDQPTITIDGATASIAIACESRLLDMNVPAERRYTNEDQQMTWPGDVCFQFVDSLQEMTLFWGGYPLSQNNI